MVEQKQQKEQQQPIPIDIKKTMPVFADSVLVANLIKISEKKDKKKNNECHLALVFIDSLTKQAVSRIIISRQTAQTLLKILDDSLKKCDKDISSFEKVKQVKSETATRYLG